MRQGSRVAAALRVLPRAVLPPSAPRAAPGEVRLFRVVTMRGDLLLGLTGRDLAALGPGPAVERVARRIAEDGRITAWRYAAARAGDGAPCLAARERVAVLGQDALTVEPHAAALPVLAPPEG